MGILKKLKNKIIYALTDKPEHYVHVDKPKTLQDHRQIQYNNWCKRNGVYNGSYLPENPNTLTKKGKGWVEVSDSSKKHNREFVRKSTGQMVRHDDENNGQYHHYHWKNGNNESEFRKKTQNEKYKDRYGVVCGEKDESHHIAPLDKDYINKRKKK